MSPSLTGMTRPISTSIASVPASIRSSLVTTASVLLPGEAQSFKSASKGIIKLEKKSDYQNVFLTIGVDLPGHLEGLRGGHVCVGRRDRQDDAVGVGDVLQD